MTKITKVVIPAAGFGTRFLPVTKAQPKEMLPIVDKPVIQYVVEEAVASGIKDIIIVTSWQKRSLEDHFDYCPELEKQLKEGGKYDKLKEVRQIAEMANFIYVRQKGPYGNATPVIAAHHVIGDEPFAVLWGDEFIYSKSPRLKQLLEVYETYGHSVISAVKVPREDVSRYGIAKLRHKKKNIHQILDIVEKPSVADAPSDLATHGGYVFTPSIVPYLKKLKPGKGGELWLVDAIRELIKKEPVYACEIKNCTYYDTGNKLEYLKANIDFALQRADLRDPLLSYLKHCVKTIK
ncbi:MAG: UTP--glucose-1-phosphate uridylyltransferase GalU [Patescibacteria group bacterium]|nr:UTP--glucose-1-phosphate uridylyltransferase GalU [Patescibacteria group bacterium]MDD5715947.1 UTP--glucose-1-phosphate uridylyltransferase GalU [Patescibacteria group bacterium]